MSIMTHRKDKTNTKDTTLTHIKDQTPQHVFLPLLFYLSDYRYGGCTTFTAHLLHTLNRKHVMCMTKAFDKGCGDFGYGIKYCKQPIEFLDTLSKMFITDMYRNFYLLDKLNDKDITIVIHDPVEIFKENEPYLGNWRIVVIRKSMQSFLKNRYGLDAKFICHPFYPYKKSLDNVVVANPTSNDRKYVVSISRVEPHKNIDVMLKANKKLKNPIKVYGMTNPHYVSCKLINLDFDKHYHGMFGKSFGQVSAILAKSKFMVDLSEIPNDGGGTQYTFLEAIYNDSAIILNRKWIESVDKKYRDFKEGYNCYAVSNEQELVELVNNSDNIDTTKVVDNASKLMHRHIKAAKEWNKVVLDNNI